MPHILILNGPNLNLLGTRQPAVYGAETLQDIEADCRTKAANLGFSLDFRQTNREYELIDWVQEARGTAQGLIINPAAYTHTSIALLDALHIYEGKVVEVHLSNVHKRESFRRFSYVSLRADAVIAGCGGHGYGLALEHMGRLLG